MQAQLYNQQGKYRSLGELLHHVPAAEKLHFLVSASIVGYLQQLNHKIPDIVTTPGKQFLVFNHYNFELINSDIKNKNDHQVAITFFSEPLIWLDTIADQLLLAEPAQPTTVDGHLIHMVKLQPFLGIHSLKCNKDDKGTSENIPG